MTFSIITVNFNNLEGLRHTTHSVLSQDIGDFQWLVIDGGSNDGSREYLETLTDTRLTWVSEKDHGIFDAMNKGIKLATQKYCIFMNSGDIFADNEVLSEVSKKVSGENFDILYGDSLERDGENLFLKQARAPKFNIYSMFTHHQAIFYNRDAIIKGYDLNYKYSGDWALTTGLLSRPNVKALYLGRVVCVFERGGVSQRSDHRRSINAEHWKILREEAKLPALVAMGLWSFKLTVNKFRHVTPALYDMIRFRNRNVPRRNHSDV